VDGQVVGIWKKAASKNKPIIFDFFDAPDGFVREKIAEAADKYSKFF
jgi:hypothetical protein